MTNADHSDYSALCSHPNLPIFILGAKGLMDLHSFRSLTFLNTYLTG